MGGKEEASLRQTTMISLPDTPPPLGVPLQYLFLFLPLFQSSPLSVSPLPPSITGLSFCRPHHSPSFFPLSSPAVTSSIPVVSISLRPPLAAHSLAEEGWDDSVCLTPPSLPSLSSAVGGGSDKWGTAGDLRSRALLFRPLYSRRSLLVRGKHDDTSNLSV